MENISVNNNPDLPKIKNNREVYLNGEFLPITKAQISVMDRGFLFGDGVYEVIPVYNKKPFRLEQHLQRLAKSLQAIQISYQIDLQQWQNILSELVNRNYSLYGDNQTIYLQITRGAALERLHTFPSENKPTIFVQTTALKTLSSEELNAGLTAITLPDIRWENCFIKTTALLANVLLYQTAREKNAHEAILIRNGEIYEAATSNVFIVKDDVIKTPPLSNYLLGGITRDFIFELAQQHNMPLLESKITEAELRAADEIWVTSSTKEIYPIVKLDEQMVGGGIPGPFWQKMIRYYHDYIKS